MPAKWEDVKRELLENGYVELGELRIELTLDNTFMELEYLPRIAVYHEKWGWRVLRNRIQPGKTLDEGWKNAIGLLEDILTGRVKPDLGEEWITREFVELIKSTIEM